MKRKFLLLTAITLSLSIGLAACAKPHEHLYAEGWSKDETYHWHQPLCDDAEEEKEAHSFIGNVCSTCGYIKEDEKDKNTGDKSEEETPGTNSNEENKGTSEQKPSEGTSEQKPSEGTSEQKPSEGTSEQKPSEGTSEQKPSGEGTSEQKPSEGTSEKTPAEREERVSEAMQMYREAVENGYQGSYLEFLSEYKDIIGARLENSAADKAMLSVVSISASFTMNGYEAPASGAGVIFKLDKTSYNAYILTNYHVIYNADTQSKLCKKIDVWLYGSENASEALSATLLGGAIDKDIAVLEIKGSDTVTESDGTTHTNREILEKSAAREITIGDSDEISVGDTVYVIGNPVGKGTSVTRGVLSVAAEYNQMPALDTTQEELNKYYNGYGSNIKFISVLSMRVDAAVNHGNSGGGLFNAFGEYVGTVEAREEGDIVGFGYAIPSNLTVAIANKIINNSDHKVTHANFGFTVKSEESESVYENGAARVRQTVIVATVNQGQNNSATENDEKLESGDEFISYQINDGEEVSIVSDHQLSTASYILKVGDKFTMKVKRGDKIVTITYLKLEEGDFVTDRVKE